MKQPKPKTFAHGVRLREEVWPKLREVMREKGRPWFESWIEKEHKKLNPRQVADLPAARKASKAQWTKTKIDNENAAANPCAEAK